MANMLFANNANTTLNGGITAVATSMVVTSATGFPAPTGSQYFYCTLADAATQTTIEIVKVTAVSGTTFTIVRGQDGTTGTIFASGAVVSLRLVRANLNDFPKLDETNTFTQAQTFSALTSGRVPYSTTGGLQTDSANLQYNGSTLSIGTAPSAWGGNFLNSLELANSTSLSSFQSGSVSSSYLTTNAYNNGSNWIYKIAFGASQYQQLSGNHYWFTAPSGTAGGTVTFTQAMQIAASGGVSIGNTTDPGATNLSVQGATLVGCTSQPNGTANGIQLKTGSGNTVYSITGTSAANQILFYNSNGAVGAIQTSASTCLFLSLSDQRLKTDLGVATDTSVIDKTIIHDFTWNVDGTKSRGVFAQEAFLIKPEAVMVGNDEVTKNDKFVNHWGVDYSKYVPDLIVYCQQLKETITSMQAALKAANISGF